MNLLSAASRAAAKARAVRTLDDTYTFQHYEATEGPYGSEDAYAAAYASGVKGRLASMSVARGSRNTQSVVYGHLLRWNTDYVLSVLDGQSALGGIKRGDKVTEVSSGKEYFVEGWFEDVAGGGVTTMVLLNREARGGG